uniref:Palmitoyltransferase AKR1 ) n=1 Tax=Ganoderma boninense TaxID=34458 RepID=A0A5K1K6J0_9APHY|nr:Palmitoyltransferase AKR1 (EC (Ankyrin repeat-containing protein AKR1) [Ganoderma boninense]
MKTIAAASLFASVALAQTVTLIPSGIGSSCSSFLNDFNQDTTLTTCTAALITASGAFAPTTNSSATTPSASDAQTALAAVCTASSACSESSVRSKLADFYQACTDELTSSQNTDVIRTYDDDSGNYCVSSIGSTTSQSAAQLASIAESISVPAVATTSTNARRAAAQVVAAVAPNATTFANNNLLFLLLQPSLSKDALCQTCTRNVITSYISFESSTPYAPGLAASVLLSGQSALYQAVQSTCGSTFLSGAVAAAAGLSGGVVGQASGSGASRTILANSGIAGVLVAAVAMVLGAAL